MMLGAISQLPEDEQQTIKQMQKDIHVIIDVNKELGILATALVAIELQQ